MSVNLLEEYMSFAPLMITCRNYFFQYIIRPTNSRCWVLILTINFDLLLRSWDFQIAVSS